MLTAADAFLPWRLTVSQGSYCYFQSTGCAGASGGTHDGGGSIDLRTTGMTSTERWRTVWALRQVGFAAWLRTPSQCGGCWPTHIHVIANCRHRPVAERRQVHQPQPGRRLLRRPQRAERAGLGNTPVQYRVPFTTWERYAGI